MPEQLVEEQKPLESATEVKPEDLTEEQKASMSFQYFTEQFNRKVYNFPGADAQIARAWANSNISPLNKEELHFGYPAEKELFDLFTEANSAKFILMVHGLVKAGVVKLLKPLIETVEKTSSEKELDNMMEHLADVPQEQTKE